MAKAQAVLRGRFKEGTVVSLVKVRDAGTLRAEGGEEVDRKKVGSENGVSVVKFTSNVEEGGRYFVVGQVDGQPLEVRVRGSAEPGFYEQPPVQPDRTRLTDGTWLDEAPERNEKVHGDRPKFEGAPHLGQWDVPKGTTQRSDTPRGSAHPHDPEEPAPYGRQEDVPEKTVQMSDTDTGRAAPLDVGPARQEDVPAGVWQRSDTPTGVATPLPKGGALAAQEWKESSAAKERRGEPVRAAAEPVDVAKTAKSKLPAGAEASDEDPKPVSGAPTAHGTPSSSASGRSSSGGSRSSKSTKEKK